MMNFGIQTPADMQDSPASYGCRGIDHGTHVDVPHDRQQFEGEERERRQLIDTLKDGLEKHVANVALEYFNEQGLRECDTPATIHSDPNVLVQARRSGGYIYVSAWLRSESKRQAAETTGRHGLIPATIPDSFGPDD